jgi:tetratricopeptide (TPR) repeat protein
MNSKVTVTQALEAALQHHRAGQLREAESIYRRVLATFPDHPDTLHLLGVLLLQSGRPDKEPVELIRRAIAINPTVPSYHGNLGRALAESGKHVEAIQAYHHALQLQPDSPDVCFDLGNAYLAIQQFEPAIEAYRKSVAMRPNDVQALVNLGAALKAAERPDEAIAVFQRALELQPASADIYNNLGLAYQDVAKLDSAISALRQALIHDPTFKVVHSNLVYLLHFHPDVTPQQLQQSLEEWNHQQAAPLVRSAQPHSNTRDSDRRLRIAYVSPDFYNQAECFFVLPLLAAHEHEHFEIHCYSSVATPDAIT